MRLTLPVNLILPRQVPETMQQRESPILSPERWSQLPPAAETPATTSCTTKRPSTRGASANAEHGESVRSKRVSSSKTQKPAVIETAVVCCFPSQAGGGSRGSVYTHQAHAGGRAEKSTWGRYGPSRSSTSHLPIHGSGSAEVPEDHQAAALPQHGEHPATPGLLHHQQHDAQGQSCDLYTQHSAFLWGSFQWIIFI